MARLVRSFAWLAWGLLCAALVGCDHATKAVARHALAERAPLPLVDGVVDLRYAENRDVAFNALSRLDLHVSPLLLAGVSFVVTVLLAWVFWPRSRKGTPGARWLDALGMALIVAGAVGNVIDRILRGYVVDFVHVHAWPVFNVADVLVVLGVAAWMVGRARARTRAPEAVTDK